MKRLKYLPIVLILFGIFFIAGCYTMPYGRYRYSSDEVNKYYSDQDSTYNDTTNADGGGYPFFGYGHNRFYSGLWGDPFYWDPFYYDYWDSPYYWAYGSYYDPFFYGGFYYPYFGSRFRSGYNHGYGIHGYLNGRYRIGINSKVIAHPNNTVVTKRSPTRSYNATRSYRMGRSGGFSRGGGFGRGGGRGRR